MKKIIILSLIILSFGIKAQTFNQTYLSDSVQIKELSNKQGLSYKIKNYDNDSYWSKAANNIFINYNDSLEITNILEIPDRDYMFKYGNKLYLLNTAFHYDYDTSFNQLFVVDSFSFIYYDIENRTENYVNINDSLIEINNKYMFLEQSKEIAIVSAPRIEMFDSNSVLNSTSFKITILDTLGNVLRYKKINRRLHDFSFEEQANNILISGVAYGTYTTSLDNKIYYINKNSLDLVDSINTDKHYLFFKTINDSIVCGITGLYTIYVDMYNTISKTVINNNYSVSSPAIHWFNQYFYNTSSLSIDFINEDSIFFVCQLRDANPYNSRGIEMFNFKRDGSLNYRYIFNDYQSNLQREINGITATREGGLIIDVMSIINYNFSNAWLLRYSHYGNLDLLDVKKEDKYTIILYPNPTKDFINIVSSDDINEITIYNSLSQNVYSKKHKGKDIEIDISYFSKGSYIVDIRTEKGNIRKKFIVE